MSYTAQIPITVTPCSLQRTAHKQHSILVIIHVDENVQGLCLLPLSDDNAQLYARNDSKKKTPPKSSALPTTLATASVWMGCTANNNAAIQEAIPKSFNIILETSAKIPLTTVWVSTLKTW